MENKGENKKVDYVEGYRTIIYIVAVIIILVGLFLGFSPQGEDKSVVDLIAMFTCWISGGIFIIFLNILKDIINELRILNSKIK